MADRIWHLGIDNSGVGVNSREPTISDFSAVSGVPAHLQTLVDIVFTCLLPVPAPLEFARPRTLANGARSLGLRCWYRLHETMRTAG